MAFRVGQKVVCVDDAPRSVGEVIRGFMISPDMDGLQMGLVYTVRGFCPCWATGEAGLYLEEIRREPGKDDGIEISFYADRFRHVVEGKTDISIFTAMLNPSKEHVRA